MTQQPLLGELEQQMEQEDGQYRQYQYFERIPEHGVYVCVKRGGRFWCVERIGLNRNKQRVRELGRDDVIG